MNRSFDVRNLLSFFTHRRPEASTFPTSLMLCRAGTGRLTCFRRERLPLRARESLPELWWVLLTVLMSLFFLTSCQDQNLTAQYIDIKMQGVFSLPKADVQYSESEIRVEPISQTYTLKDVVMTDSLGVEYDLYSNKPTDYRISSRTQRIYRKELDNSFLDQTFVSLKITFSNKIVGASKFKSNHKVSLQADGGADYIVAYDDGFSLSAGQKLIFNISVKWKKTVLRKGGNGSFTESMEAPGLSVDLQKS